MENNASMVLFEHILIMTSGKKPPLTQSHPYIDRNFRFSRILAYFRHGDSNETERNSIRHKLCRKSRNINIFVYSTRYLRPPSHGFILLAIYWKSTHLAISAICVNGTRIAFLLVQSKKFWNIKFTAIVQVGCVHSTRYGQNMLE